jgi:hypothetical protein
MEKPRHKKKTDKLHGGASNNEEAVDVRRWRRYATGVIPVRS